MDIISLIVPISILRINNGPSTRLFKQQDAFFSITGDLGFFALAEAQHSERYSTGDFGEGQS